MLSALAKYIFGGVIRDEPDPAMECETKEVNDWLLINMPNQPSEDVNLDFDNDNDDDDDDILSALPLLLSPNNYDCDNSYSENQFPQEMDLTLDTRVATQSSLLSECLEDFQILPECLYLNHSLYYPSDFSLVVTQSCKGFNCSTTRNPDQSFFLAADMKCPNRGPLRTITVKIEKAPVLSDKRIHHPAAFSKNYINHRSPALPPKAALLEQIKELKPVQRAIGYEMKKIISRTQLSRQNKNYIYESSTKTNRRKNLQRHHSGANNNRKC